MRQSGLAVILLLCTFNAIKCVVGEGTDGKDGEKAITGRNNGVGNDGYGNGMNNGMNNKGVDGGNNNGNGNKGNMNGRNNGNDNYMPRERYVSPWRRYGSRRVGPTYRRDRFDKSDEKSKEEENNSTPDVPEPVRPKIKPTVPESTTPTKYNPRGWGNGHRVQWPTGRYSRGPINNYSRTSSYRRTTPSYPRGPSIYRRPSRYRAPGRGNSRYMYGYRYSGGDEVDSQMNSLDRFLGRLSQFPWIQRGYYGRRSSTRGKQSSFYNWRRFSYRDPATRIHRAQERCKRWCNYLGKESRRCESCNRTTKRMQNRYRGTTTVSYTTSSE